jgi:hypothetical protein
MREKEGRGGEGEATLPDEPEPFRFACVEVAAAVAAARSFRR